MRSRLVLCSTALISLGAAGLAGPPRAAGAATATVAQSDPGTQAAYAATPEASSPTAEPQNPPVAYAGAPLVLQSSLTGREAGEPSLGVDKSGTVFFPGDTFDTPGGALARNLEFRSTDGGLTWTDVTPNLGGQATHPLTLDTITYVDRDLGRAFTVDTLAAGGSVLSFSDDKGQTWTTTAALAAGVNDHETVATGVVPAGSSLVTLDPAFPKLVYYCVNTVAAVSCSRSLDGGRTFEQMNSPFPTHPLQNLPLSSLCSSLTGHLTTDPQGRLFLPSAFNEVAGCGQLRVAVSSDGGTTWSDFPVSTIKDDYNNASVASDSAGNLYVVWQDDRFNLPYMAVSRDHGQTWSTPVMVAPPGVRVTNFPILDAGDPGRVAISFPGSSDATADTDGTHAPWSYYVALSADALDPSPHFVAQVAAIPGQPAATTVMHRGACRGRCGGLFDFLDVKVAPTPGGPAWAALSDDCTGDCVTTPGQAGNDPSAGQGIAVRELAGPAQTGPLADLPGSAPPPTAPEAPLAVLLPAIAGLALGGRWVFRRRHRGPAPG